MNEETNLTLKTVGGGAQARALAEKSKEEKKKKREKALDRFGDAPEQIPGRAAGAAATPARRTTATGIEETEVENKNRSLKRTASGDIFARGAARDAATLSLLYTYIARVRPSICERCVCVCVCICALEEKALAVTRAGWLAR